MDIFIKKRWEIVFLSRHKYGPHQRPSQGRAALVALAPCPALPSRAGRNFFFKPCPGCPAGQGRAKFFALLTFLLKIVIQRFSS